MLYKINIIILGETMKKKLIIISMIIMMIIPCSVSAKTLQDLKNELANLQSELATNKNNKALTQKEALIFKNISYCICYALTYRI